jgi:hypothetical protein
MCDARIPDASFTDGVFWWYSDLAHYVGVHGVRLPERFMNHVRDSRVELLARGSDYEWWDAQVEAHLRAPGRGYLVGAGDASEAGEELFSDAGGPLRWLGVDGVVDEDRRTGQLESLVGWDWPRASWEEPFTVSVDCREDGQESWSLSTSRQIILFEPGHVPGPDWALSAGQSYALSGLRNNRLLRVVEEPQPCPLCGELVGCSEFTDGVFLWRESLVHYVQVHAMWLPSQFMEYAERREDELLALPLDSTWWDSLSGWSSAEA